jgi:branched-chain amino acid transport system permease protein
VIATTATGRPLQQRLLRFVPILVIVVFGIVLPFLLNDYWLSTAASVLIAAIGALGLQVLTGRTGQISLGHAFFLATGAYIAGWLGGNEHLSAAVWIPVAGIVAGVLGAVTGPFALRLRGLYLAIVTIGLVYIGQYVVMTWSGFSGGPGGRSIPDPTFGGLNFANGFNIGSLFIDRNGCYYYLAFVLLAIAMLYVRNVMRSSLGRSMVAVRDRELAAAVLGVNVAHTKVRAFVISSALAGISGALFGAFLSFVVPQEWGLVLSIQYVVMIVVGGMTSLWGPLLGSIFVIGLPALLQDVSGSLPFLYNGSNNGVIAPSDASNIVFGVVLVAFLILEPRGVVGIGYRLAGVAQRRRRSRPANLDAGVAAGEGLSDSSAPSQPTSHQEVQPTP